MIKHHSAGGVYMREQTLNAGNEVEKHQHDYDHLSFLCAGIAVVEVSGEIQTLHAPYALTIKAGEMHKIYAVTNITWLCIHAEAVADPEVTKE